MRIGTSHSQAGRAIPTTIASPDVSSNEGLPRHLGVVDIGLDRR
jgi:hypothetical protein